MNRSSNGSSSNHGRRRLAANGERSLVYPTPANQDIYNRYRNRLEQARLRSHIGPTPNPALLSPGAPSDGGSLFEDDARSTSDVSEGDEYNNPSQLLPGVAPIANTSAPTARGQRTRGRRRQPLSMEAKFEAAVVRKLNLACDAHRRRRVKCTCNDLSLFEEAWEHSRAPAVTRQPELAPRQYTEPPAAEDYLGGFQQNELAPSPHLPEFHIFDPDGIDLAAGAVPRASTTNFLSQYGESTLPSRPIVSPADSDNSMPLFGAGSWTDAPHQSCVGDVVAIEHGDRHGYWWVCQFCRTSVDTISMARDHYRDSHLQPPWDDDRIYRLQCTSCRTTSEVYDFSLEPPREFCPITQEQSHAWQLLASVNNATYSAAGSEAITGIDSIFSNFLPPSSVSSYPDDSSPNQLYYSSSRFMRDHTWRQQHVIRRSGDMCASVVIVRDSKETDDIHLLLLPKCFQPHLLDVDHISERKPSIKFNHDHHFLASRLTTFTSTTINDFARPVCKVLAGMAETILSLVMTTIMVVAAIVRLRRPMLVRARGP